MTTLISPDGREYRPGSVVERQRLITGFGYTIKPDEKTGEVFHPENHSVDEVNQYVKDNPDDGERVLAEERAGRARITVVG